MTERWSLVLNPTHGEVAVRHAELGDHWYAAGSRRPDDHLGWPKIIALSHRLLDTRRLSCHHFRHVAVGIAVVNASSSLR